MATRTIVIEGSSGAELQANTPDVALLPGSTGHVEVFAKRVLGICPLPLGPLMSLPLAGDLLAQAIAPHGAVVTDRGGIGGIFACDAFFDWAIPVPVAQDHPCGCQGQDTPMGIAPIVYLIALVGAIALALFAFGWAIDKIKMTVQAVVEGVGPVGGFLLLAGVVVIGLLLAKYLAGGRKRRRPA